MLEIILLAIVGVLLAGTGALLVAMAGVIVNRAGKKLGNEVSTRIERGDYTEKVVKRMKGEK